MKIRSSESDRIVIRKLTLMRIRFRASDFGQVAKINIIRAKSKQVFVRRWCSSHFFFCSCDSESAVTVGLWTQKIQANVDYSYVPRRAECSSLGPGLKHPSLRSLTFPVVWPRRDVPRRFTWYCFQQASEPSTMSCCVYSRM